MSNLLQRIITGLVFLAVVIGCIVWNIYSLASLFYVVAILSLWEFYSMVRTGGYRPQLFGGIITGTAIYLLIEMIKLDLAELIHLTILAPFFIVNFVAELFRKKEMPFANLAFTILGLIYIVVPFALLNIMTFIDPVDGYNAEVVLGFFIVIWLNDTGGYIFGRLLGKRKLFPRLSPKKTWEGALGGILLALGGARVLSEFFTQISLLEWLILTILSVVFGILGDLVESMLKRHFKTKDSSKFLPGHGGLLDRFDAVLLASPIVFTYLILFVF